MSLINVLLFFTYWKSPNTPTPSHVGLLFWRLQKGVSRSMPSLMKKEKWTKRGRENDDKKELCLRFWILIYPRSKNNFLSYLFQEWFDEVGFFNFKKRHSLVSKTASLLRPWNSQFKTQNCAILVALPKPHTKDGVLSPGFAPLTFDREANPPSGTWLNEKPPVYLFTLHTYIHNVV